MIICRKCSVKFLVPISILSSTHSKEAQLSVETQLSDLEKNYRLNDTQLRDKYQQEKQQLEQAKMKFAQEYQRLSQEKTNDTMQVSITNSIAARLLRIVFSIYCIITIALTLSHMLFEYRSAKDSIMEDLKKGAEVFNDGVGLALWHEDQEQVSSMIQGALNFPGIIGMKVEQAAGDWEESGGIALDAEGQLIRHENEETNEQIRSDLLKEIFFYSTEVIFEEEGEGIVAGTITLYSSTSVVFDQVKDGFLVILVNAALKTLALWIIFLIVSRYVLTRPLSILGNAVGHLNLDNLTASKINIGTKGNNEIKLLEVAFNRMVNKLVEEKQFLSQVMDTFEKFVPKQFLAHAANDGIHSIKLGKIMDDDLSVLYSTLVADPPLLLADSTEVFTFLNNCVQHLEEPIERNGGFIDKFTGETLLALFDLDSDAHEAMYAIYAALDMLRGIENFNSNLSTKNIGKIEIHIGIHSGKLGIGTVGGALHMEPMIVGEAMEIGERLTKLALMYGSSLLVSEKTVDLLSPGHPFLFREVDYIKIAGLEPMYIYEVLNAEPTEARQKKSTNQEGLKKAIAAYRHQDWNLAMEEIKAYQQQNPDDPLARLYFNRCAHNQQSPPPTDWDGTWYMRRK